MNRFLGNCFAYGNRFSGGNFGRGSRGMMGGYGFRPIGGILFLIILAIAAYFLVKHFKNKKGWGESYNEALLILNNRLAEGDISEEEYKSRKELLINGEKKAKSGKATSEPLEVLNERFAKGEITEEEYKGKKDLLIKK